VKQPSLKEVWQAAMTLGYSPEMTEKAAISYSPWDKTGYVTVKKGAQRATMLKGIAGEIVKTRQKEAQALEQQQQHKKR
jgi:signal recognition particle subunit SEC65